MSRVDPVLLLICSLLLGAISGCGGGSGFAGLPDAVADPVADDPDGSTTTTTVGQDGGTASSDDGSLTLTFPAGALSMDTEVTIERREVTEVPELFGDAPIVAYYELGPSGLQLDLPVQAVVQGLGNPVMEPDTLLGLFVEFRGVVECIKNVGGDAEERLEIELARGVTALPGGRTNPEAFTLLVLNEESDSSSLDDECFLNIESCTFLGVVGTDSSYIAVNLATGASEFAIEGNQSFGAAVVARPPRSGVPQKAVVLDFGPDGSFRQLFDA